MIATKTQSIIEQAKAIPVIAVCRHLLPDGELEDDEWVVRNPNRYDESAGSFCINIVNGRFKDFAEPNTPGGNDVVALWKFVRKTGSMLDAAKQLLQELDGCISTADYDLAGQHQGRSKPVYAIMPVPDDAPKQPRDISHHEYGKPTRGTFRYYDQDRRLLGYVCQWDATEDRKKITRPYFFCEMSDGHQRWAWSGPKGEQPRPLYRLETLGEARTVVLCEGEHKAYLGSTMLPPTTAVLGWLGGSSAAPYVDLSPLAGRIVVLFPDHDAQRDDDGNYKPYNEQPGVQAMHSIGARLLGMGCKVWMVDYMLGEMPAGWDLADAFADKWTTAQVQAYIMSHKRDFSKPSTLQSNYDEMRDALWASKKLYADLSLEEFPITDLATNKKFDVWQNVNHMLTLYGIQSSYDAMRKEASFVFPDGPRSTGVAMDEIYSLCTVSRLKTGALDKHLNVITRKHSYHPVIHWVSSQPWDRRDRIDDLIATIHAPAERKSMIRQLVVRWMLSAIALVYRERMGARGAQPTAHGVLTFTGIQGSGKTSWFQSLAPGDMVLCGASLQVGTKDSEVTALRSWITELGEVGSTFRRSDLDALKAFLIRPTDVIRMPYGKTYDAMPRQTVFASSVNDRDFLADKSGNRRWWVIETNRLDYDHDIDTQQLWAQILVLYRQGEQWHLKPDEFECLEKSNESHMQPNPVEQILAELDWTEASHSRWSWQTAGSILLRLTHRQPSIGECRDAAKSLRSIENIHEKSSGKNQLFWIPLPK